MWRGDADAGPGAFANLRLRPQQIVSQLLDTLNRAALNALSLSEAFTRQSHMGPVNRSGASTWMTLLRPPAPSPPLPDRQPASDLSLTVEVFDTQLVRHPGFTRYFRASATAISSSTIWKSRPRRAELRRRADGRDADDGGGRGRRGWLQSASWRPTPRRGGHAPALRPDLNSQKASSPAGDGAGRQSGGERPDAHHAAERGGRSAHPWPSWAAATGRDGRQPGAGAPRTGL